MTFNIEDLVPREKTIIFDDRVAASAGTLFQIVSGFFDPFFLLYQIEFGENLCWMGFRTARTGDENRGWVRIESALAFSAADEKRFSPLNISPIEVGTVSIQSLSPISSHVLIWTNYTPEALAFLFNGLARYLIWVVNGEDAREAWTRAVSRDIQVLHQVDAGDVPLLKAPREATEHTQEVEAPPTAQSVQESKTDQRKTRRRRRTAKRSTERRTKPRIYVPTNPQSFEKWRKMWRLIRQTQREYWKLADQDMTLEPNPTFDELRDAIKDKLGRKPSEKTVRRVIRAGTAGRLKKT